MKFHTCFKAIVIFLSAIHPLLKAQERQLFHVSKPAEFTVHTTNILGIFDDPFEFAGDYGPESNAIRQKVFDAVISKTALAQNIPLAQLKQLGIPKEELVARAIQEDKEYGPTLAQVVTPRLRKTLEQKQKTLKGFTPENLNDLQAFLNKYANKKIFFFLRNNPSDLLKFDKILIDDASREGKMFAMPILGSRQRLAGTNSEELKENLLHAVLTDKNISLAKPELSIKKSIDSLDPDYLKKYLENATNNQDLYAFASPAGQAFFYWLYQALNLDLISQNPAFIQQVNKVKADFDHTLGDPKKRALLLKKQLIAADSKVVFAQESDSHVPRLLTEDKLFLPIDKQNFKDGTVVFLRSDFWEPNYEIIAIDDYDGYKEGRLTLILATQKGTGQKFLLASGHGHSTKSEDGRLQIKKIVEALNRLTQERNENIKLIIGVDANTKTKEDVQQFRTLLNQLGLEGTSVGPTTIKRRMVTAQNSKAGKFAVDEEDYIIVKRDQLNLVNPTVGFSTKKIDPNIPLPNINNQSDHYAVGAVVTSTPIRARM